MQGDRNEAWRRSYPDERGDGRWPSGEHEGAYGAQHGGYISGPSPDGADNPGSPANYDRWSRDVGRHEDRWSHGGYDASEYGGEHYADRAPSDERMSRGFDPRMSHGYGSERMSERFDTMNDVPSYHPSSAARREGFGASDVGRSRPMFLGKGPKGYTRSDERIREEICERLSEGYLDASDIEVVVQDGEVTLTGSIADRRTKRLAEELADGVRGVKDIENRLKLRSSGPAEAPKTEAPKSEAQAKSSQNGAASQRV
jgi:hypothetical protein